MMHRASPLLLALLTAASLGAQAAPAGPTPPPCQRANYRQLDFWLGEWRVLNPAGTVVGHNTIASAEGGCLVTERWRSAGGSDGQSMNFFNPSTGTWHQVWVDNSGGALMFVGTPETDAMVYRGETGRGATAQRHRMTLRRQADGTVRQLWETWPVSDTTDAARTVSFDGTYHRVK
jgi:hypothetical protein